MEKTFLECGPNLILGPIRMKLTECRLFDPAGRPAQLQKRIQPLLRIHFPKNLNLIVVRFHKDIFRRG